MAYVWHTVEKQIDDLADAVESLTTERKAAMAAERSIMAEAAQMRAETAQMRAEAEGIGKRMDTAVAVVTRLCDALERSKRETKAAREIVEEQDRVVRRVGEIQRMATGDVSAILMDVCEMLSGNAEAAEVAHGDLEARARTAGNPSVIWDDEGRAHFGGEMRPFLHDEQLQSRYNGNTAAYPDGFAKR